MSTLAVSDVSDVSVSRGRGGDHELAALLDEIDIVLRRYVAFPSVEALWTVAVWIVHTWIVESFDTTPRLAVLSPEKGSGKTRVLELLVLLCRNAQLTVQISPAALYTMIDGGAVTLLMDEADSYLGTKVSEKFEELRGLVNAGYRRGAVVPRVEMAGKQRNLQMLPAYAPAALAGIGDLPDTILDRSAVIAMKRRRSDEDVEQFRQRRAERETAELKDRLHAWSMTIGEEDFDDLEPDLPPGIVDRAADVWEPLIILGDRAGAEWSQRVRQASVLLNGLRQERDPSLGIRLLADVRTLFTEHGVDRMHTDVLLSLLTQMDEAPWGDLHGRELDSRGLAKRLRPYDVRPAQIRVGDITKKGYSLDSLAEAFDRYLPPPSDLGTAKQPKQPKQATDRGLDVDGYEADYPDLFEVDQ